MKLNEIPENILYYLTNSYEIRDTELLFEFLKDYTNEFNGEVEFGMYHLVGNDYYFYDGHISVENKVVENEINKFKLIRNTVLEHDEFKVFPVFEGELIKEVCIYKVLKGKDSFFNKLFMKTLNDIQLIRSIQLENKKLFQLSHTDEVTGLYNQRKLALDLESTIDDHKTQNKTFSLMFIDIDHFKRVNDNYGHIIGSKMLIDIGAVLKYLLRASDDIYRYGGDEFIVIMRNVNLTIVQKIALRILESIKKKDFIVGKDEVYHLSVSIGIAEFPTDAKTSKEIIKFADEMMYESKKSGRGKVFHLGREVIDDSISS